MPRVVPGRNFDKVQRGEARNSQTAVQRLAAALTVPAVLLDEDAGVDGVKSGPS